MISKNKTLITILLSLLLLIPLACKKPVAAPAAPTAPPPPISLAPQRTIFQCPPAQAPLHAFFTPDGHFVLITSSGRFISTIHNLDTTGTDTSPIFNLPANSTRVISNADGTVFAAAVSNPPSITLIYRDRLPGSNTSIIPITLPDTITDLLFSPDSKILAVAIAEPGHDRVELHSTSTGQLTINIPFSSPITALAYSPDNTLLAIANGNLLHLIDAQTGQPHPTTMLYREKPTDYLASLAFSPDSATLATYVTDGALSLWTTSTGDQQKPLRHFPRSTPPLPLAFSPDGRYLATGADHPLLLLAKTLETKATLSSGSHPLTSFIFSPPRPQLYTTDQSGAIQQWDLTSLK